MPEIIEKKFTSSKCLRLLSDFAPVKKWSWLFFLVAVLGSSCGNESRSLEKDIADGAVPDSAYILLKKLQSFDSSLMSIKSFNNFTHADTILRNSFTESSEFMGDSDRRFWANVYERLFEVEGNVRGYSALWKGEQAVQDAQFHLAKKYFSKASFLFEQNNDSSSLGHTLNWLGAVHSYLGNNLEATRYHYKARQLYESMRDSTGVVSSMREIAGTFSNQGLYGDAEKTFFFCLGFYERLQDTISQASVHSAIGEVYHQMGKPALSEKHFSIALDLFTQENYPAGIAQGYNNMAIYKMTSGAFEDAKKWLLKSKLYADSIGDDVQIPVFLYNYGVCEDETGNNAAALTYINACLEESKKRGHAGDMNTRCLKRLSKIHGENGDYKKALEYQISYDQLRDSLNNENNTKAIEELNLQHQTTISEVVIRQARQENENAKFWVWVLSGSVFVLLLGIFAGISFWIYRNKRSKEIATMENGLRQSEISRIKQELDFNKQQLSDYIETLKDKSIQIISLEDQIKTTLGEENGLRLLNEGLKQSEELIDSIYGFKILTDEDWTRFKRYFDNVYPGMIQKLRELQPEITAAEQRLFMLIRLNSDSKEIANMLGISPESVRKTKYRLKKKLSLSEDISLDEYIRKF
jgi:tetratricopeptide (TPR) repeat protein